jgi:hypothetical protein
VLVVVIVTIAKVVCKSVWDLSEVKMGSDVIHCHKIQLIFHLGLSYVKLYSSIAQTLKIEAEMFSRNMSGCHLSAKYSVPEDFEYLLRLHSQCRHI